MVAARPPAAPRSPRWRTFLRLHAPHIWATDLFTVQTLTFRTFYVVGGGKTSCGPPVLVMEAA